VQVNNTLYKSLKHTDLTTNTPLIMCGIFSLLNNDNVFSAKEVNEAFKKGKRRGPENSQLERVNILCDFGFHRLAINGLSAISNQPITVGDITLICNGEIYNYKELYKYLSIEPTTESDCEVIIHLYLKFGIEYTLQQLDGVFAFILCDSRLTNEDSKIYIARDPYGIRPLYCMKPKRISDESYKESIIFRTNHIYAFASEIKCLINMSNYLNDTHHIVHFEPGTYSVFSLPFTVSPKWFPQINNRKYHSTGFGFHSYFTSSTSNKIYIEQIYNNINRLLRESVQKRIHNTERPIACLLSGGLDSSIITALVNYYRSDGTQLETYSIGLDGSEDLRHARIVADYLGTKHTEVILTETEFIDAIPEVIQAIESYDTTTVRASIGNYKLAKYIAANSDAKVIFNGDGADELCGGYLYMGHAPSALDFDYECRRLLTDIHKFDVLRSDKSISSNGLEPRTPFLDRSFVQYYLSIHPQIRFHRDNNTDTHCEKYLLRNAFQRDALLPDSILWRRKEAFSDGVSHVSRSLFTIIQEYVDKLDLSSSSSANATHNKPDTNEKKYYRHLYDTFYPNTEQLLPYFWMPKWVDATDASARTLVIY